MSNNDDDDDFDWSSNFDPADYDSDDDRIQCIDCENRYYIPTINRCLLCDEWICIDCVAQHVCQNE